MRPEDERASTTDPDATVMKRGDSGFRPAYNLQYGTDVESRIIVGVDVATTGSDQGQRVPMLEQVVERCGQARNRGLQRLPVRGLDKVKGVALLFALAHNLMRRVQLLPAWFGIGTGSSAAPEMLA